MPTHTVIAPLIYECPKCKRSHHKEVWLFCVENNSKVIQLYKIAQRTKYMRELQYNFFHEKEATAKRQYLNDAKRLEDEVDKMISDYDSGQQDLFTSGNHG